MAENVNEKDIKVKGFAITDNRKKDEQSDVNVFELFAAGYAEQGDESTKKLRADNEQRQTDADNALEKSVKDGNAAPIEYLAYGFQNSKPVRQRGQDGGTYGQ